jgi:hypothetical protein
MGVSSMIHLTFDRNARAMGVSSMIHLTFDRIAKVIHMHNFFLGEKNRNS